MQVLWHCLWNVHSIIKYTYASVSHVIIL